MVKENKHYKLTDPIKNKTFVFKVLKINELDAEVYNLETKETSLINKAFLINFHKPCYIDEEILKLLNFKRLNDGIPIFSDTKKYVAKFISGKNLNGKYDNAEFEWLGYAVVSESEIKEVTDLYKDCGQDGWSERIKDRFNLVHYIDDII